MILSSFQQTLQERLRMRMLRSLQPILPLPIAIHPFAFLSTRVQQTDVLQTCSTHAIALKEREEHVTDREAL